MNLYGRGRAGCVSSRVVFVFVFVLVIMEFGQRLGSRAVGLAGCWLWGIARGGARGPGGLWGYEAALSWGRCACGLADCRAVGLRAFTGNGGKTGHRAPRLAARRLSGFGASGLLGGRSVPAGGMPDLRVRGFAGSRALGLSGSRVRGLSGSRAVGLPGSRAPGFAGSRACGLSGSREIGHGGRLGPTGDWALRDFEPTGLGSLRRGI